MSETEAPQTQPLVTYLSKVKVTDGQAIRLLNNLAEGQYDRDPSLVAAINQAISDISNPQAEAKEEAPAEEGPTPTY